MQIYNNSYNADYPIVTNTETLVTNIHTNVRYIPLPIQLFPYIYPKIRSTVQNILSFLLVLVSIISGINLNGQQPIPPNPPAGYRLVFHKEFDYKVTPDSSKWRFDTGFSRNHVPSLNLFGISYVNFMLPNSYPTFQFLNIP